MPIRFETPGEWRIQYEKHIRSTRWKNTRVTIIKMRGEKCERCPRTTGLELHHKTYERLGHESPSDLELLCQICHKDADRQREAKGRATRERARHNRALDTYASKKYGDEWQDRLDCDEIEEEFERWLERKEEEW
jgi:hypothetical protein